MVAKYHTGSIIRETILLLGKVVRGNHVVAKYFRKKHLSTYTNSVKGGSRFD